MNDLKNKILLRAFIYLLQRQKFIKRIELLLMLKKQMIKEDTRIQDLMKELKKLNPLKFSSLSDLLIDAKNLSVRCQELSINISMWGDSNYPKLLQASDSAPVIIFYQGNIDKLNEEKYKYLAVVGCRKISSYGEAFIKQELSKLSTYNVAIISGLARGVDGLSHRVALKEDLFTAAVLAHGLDLTYPREHRNLKQQIAEKGVILSEHGPGEMAIRQYFPARNRIISALSQAVLVVEAGAKSGSLITAGFAADQGRDVMALPGSIFAENSRGCNNLIKDGSTLVQNHKDILRALGVQEIEQKSRIQEEKLFQEKLANLKHDTLLNKIISILEEGEVTEVELAQRAGLAIQELEIIVTKLESLGVIGRAKAKLSLTKLL